MGYDYWLSLRIFLFFWVKEIPFYKQKFKGYFFGAAVRKGISLELKSMQSYSLLFTSNNRGRYFTKYVAQSHV